MDGIVREVKAKTQGMAAELSIKMDSSEKLATEY